VERALDGVCDFRGQKRWIPQESRDPTDWFEVEFENETEFSRVELAICDDGPAGRVQPPAEYAVEFWDGNRWAEVRNQRRKPARPAGNQWNRVDFEKIKAKKLRVVFTHGGTARSGISEIAVWP
jgi:hypothetical protein